MDSINFYGNFYSNNILYIIKFPDDKVNKIIDCETKMQFSLISSCLNDIHIFKCPLKIDEHTEHRLNRRIKILNDEYSITYKKYPSFENEIIISTLVKHEDNYLPQWIEYHMNLGVTRFIIYDNKNAPTKNTNDFLTHDDIRINTCDYDLRDTLKKYIDKDIVIIIDWPYPYVVNNKSHAQIIQQNHSLYAFRKAKYIGFLDVDEYVNPQGFSTIDDAFSHVMKYKNKDRSHFGSFILKNRWFYNPLQDKTSGVEFFNIEHTDSITEKGHEKTFVVPENTTLMNIHIPEIANNDVKVDKSIMIFNHYCYLNKTTRGLENKGIYDNSIQNHLHYLPKKHKLITNIFAGLGNQMFQVATGYTTAKTQRKEFHVNNILKNGHSDINYFENVFRKCSINTSTTCNIFKEPEHDFTKRLDIPLLSSDITIQGYFQNEDYFIHNRNDILELFSIEPHREIYINNKYPHLNKGVFIHYRRGDYLLYPEYNITNDEYYKRGIAIILEKHPDAIFHICSDDLLYCRKLDYINIFGEKVVYVEEDEINCLYIMSKCHYGGIGANSSFSWWGGWLNQNMNKNVIYPDMWKGDRKDLNIWWKGSHKIRNRPKNFFLTFGGGNMHYLDAVDRIVEQAKSLEIFDEFFGFKENDLKADHDFWEPQHLFILVYRDRFGFRMWQSYLIKKVMDIAQYDDIIVYCDCGNELDIRKKEEIKKLLDIVEHDHLIANYVKGGNENEKMCEINRCKKDLLEYLEIEENDPILHTKQRKANPIILKKTKHTEKFINEWYNISFCNNHFLNQYPSFSVNHNEFIVHDENSLFSILTKKYNLFSDTTTEGVIDTNRNVFGPSQLK